jgi:hypothetical protein
MKNFLALVVLVASMGAMAQTEITQVLDKKEIAIDSDRAILVRTAQTPNKVTVTFQVPMANSFCAEPRSEYVPRTCFRRENVYRTQQVCRQVPVSTPAPTGPRGGRYNPGQARTTTVCNYQQVYVGTVNRSYDCSYVNNYCARYATSVNRESDKVKIKFKNLPTLGGTEQETYSISAKQRTKDGSNVVYDIKVLTTAEGREYEVKKKGILGFDSYVIKQK